MRCGTRKLGQGVVLAKFSKSKLCQIFILEVSISFSIIHLTVSDSSQATGLLIAKIELNARKSSCPRILIRVFPTPFPVDCSLSVFHEGVSLAGFCLSKRGD